jgi:hypothetical protein
MFIRLGIETWVIIKAGTKSGEQKKGVNDYGKRYGGCWVLMPLCVLRCISAVVAEGTCVKDFRRQGLCTVGTVG